MGRYEPRLWEGDPAGSTRAERRPCRYDAYVPDALTSAALALPADVAADLVDVEQAVRRLNDQHPGLANLEPLARFLLRAEAVASSNIEGLVLNVRRLARSEAAEREGLPVTDDTARSVLGNIRALDEALTGALLVGGMRGVYVKHRPKQGNTVVDTRKESLAPKHAVSG